MGASAFRLLTLKARVQKDADIFYNYYNNREFNSIEEHICHLAFVERIELMNSSKVRTLLLELSPGVVSNFD